MLSSVWSIYLALQLFVDLLNGKKSSIKSYIRVAFVHLSFIKVWAFETTRSFCRCTAQLCHRTISF